MPVAAAIWSLEAPGAPRTVSEALVATVLELGYRQAPHRGASERPVLLGQQAYMCRAPFIGVDAASELVAERMGWWWGRGLPVLSRPLDRLADEIRFEAPQGGGGALLRHPPSYGSSWKPAR